MHEVLAAQVSRARRYLQSEFEQLQDGDLNLVVQNVTPTQQTQSTNQTTPQLKINQVSLHEPVLKQRKQTDCLPQIASCHIRQDHEGASVVLLTHADQTEYVFVVEVLHDERFVEELRHHVPLVVFVCKHSAEHEMQFSLINEVSWFVKTTIPTQLEDSYKYMYM